MKKPEADEPFVVTHSWDVRWDHDGRCFERENDGPETRRPELDFGTPDGDVLIDPWIQDALKDER